MNGHAKISLLLSCLLAACQTGKNAIPPEKSAFTVRLEYSAGMLPDYKIIYISADSSFYEARQRGATFRDKFTCTGGELDSLENMASRYHFFSMQHEDRGKVYDRGGTVISMGPKGKEYTVNNSGSHFLKQQYQEDFHRIEAEIIGFAAKKTGH